MQCLLFRNFETKSYRQLKQLHQLSGVAYHGGQRVVRDASVVFRDGRREIVHGFFQDPIRIGGLERLSMRRYAGVIQQIIEQPSHPPGAVDGSIEEFVGFFVQLRFVSLPQQLTIAGNRPLNRFEHRLEAGRLQAYW